MIQNMSYDAVNSKDKIMIYFKSFRWTLKPAGRVETGRTSSLFDIFSTFC